MPTITQLEYLVAVSRTQHFGKAAEECHVSQPSLSAQIQKLEEELGITVFDRSIQPVKVTDQGADILKQARTVLAEHKRLFDISSAGKELSGKFHLGVIPSLSAYVIPLFVESFAHQYPKVDLTISELKTEDIIKSLSEDRIDAGLLVTPLYEKSIHEVKLFYEPFTLFVSEQHPLYQRKTIKDSDLDGSSVWLLDEGHCFRDQVIKVCSMKSRHDVLKNVHFSSGSLETLINLIRRGRGYTLLPLLATTHLSKKEKERNLKYFTNPIPTREVSLVHSRRVLKRGFIDALKKEIMAQVPSEIERFQGKKMDIIDI